MSRTIPKFADENRRKQEINEGNTKERDSLSKMSRANEDASREMSAIDIKNYDATSPPPDWRVQITTEYATALFSIKYTGPAESISQANTVLEKANRILLDRFQPVRSRVS